MHILNMFKLNINKKMYHYLFLLSIVILAIAIGLYFGLPNNKKESFIPVINKLYRPHVRNARMFLDDKVTKLKTKVSLHLKKIGII